MFCSRSVFHTAWHGDRQTTRWFDIAHQEVNKCITHLLTRKPRVHNCINFIQPWHSNRRSGIDDHNRALTHFGNFVNENVLLPWKINVFAIPAFTLPVVIGANDNHADITLRGKVNRFTQLIVINWSHSANSQTTESATNRCVTDLDNK